MREEHVCCHDCSTADVPLILQFPADHVDSISCNLDHLVGPWHQAHGMKAGLLRAEPIICVQIERMIERQPDQIEKCSCAIDLEHETMLPVFLDAGTQCELLSYIPVAAAIHHGLDGAGHYQALLKIQPIVVAETKAAQWLVTQDNERPQPCWTIPQTLSQNTTLIWLVRTDCLQLPPFTNLPTTSFQADSHDVTAILALLHRTEDIAQTGSIAPSDPSQ